MGLLIWISMAESEVYVNSLVFIYLFYFVREGTNRLQYPPDNLKQGITCTADAIRAPDYVWCLEQSCFSIKNKLFVECTRALPWLHVKRS